MTLQSLVSLISLEEDSTRQFKADVKNANSLASKMPPFANTNGGMVLSGHAEPTNDLLGMEPAV